MAPILVRAMHLQRRAQLTTAGYVLIISLVSLAVSALFCVAVFFLICKKQRDREKAHRRMQEERRPFVAPLAQQYVLQPNAQNLQPYQYDGPIELQGSGHLGQMHGQMQNQMQGQSQAQAQAQQLDGYAVAAQFDNSRPPVEMPSHAATK
ncbi:hypothetical protein BKA66DRAFT_323410 [Pyrenochaeta sp. MPI-SDFR-AT-0127]|nr:hypothetical protein BKA66DRAFT_323410 [Pyrenochaeta sp. MPI-SDFR-AT-0127]